MQLLPNSMMMSNCSCRCAEANWIGRDC